MDPNTLTNVGTDIGVVISAVLIWIIAFWGIFVIRILAKKYTEVANLRKKADNGEILRVAVMAATWRLALSILIVCGLFATGGWVMYGAYGPGDPIQITPEDDGFWKQTQEAPDEITDEEKEKLGQKKLPPILMEVKQKASKNDGTEDDYIRKAIKRSQQMSEGEKK